MELPFQLPAGKQLKAFTRAEVAKHNSEGDCWLIVDSLVYDVSKFADLHPGGAGVLLEANVAGKDATEAFYGLHKQEVIVKFGPRLCIGHINGEKPVFVRKTSELSRVPYGEPAAFREGFHSPFYTPRHIEFKKALRAWMEENVAEEASLREQDGKRPSKELWKKMGDPNINLWAIRLGPGPHLKGRTLMNGTVTAEEFDAFHTVIAAQEFGRMVYFGFLDGLGAGNQIALPTIVHHAKSPLKEKIIEEVLSGDKIMALAITEAFAGSDTSGLKTTATLSDDGKHWIVNGTKKWITNGTFADYFSTAVRSIDKNGKAGFTMLLIPRGEGVETKAIKTVYSASAGTSFVTFDNVKVPVENVLGKVGDGQRVLLTNFNMERFGICINIQAMSRRIVREAIMWSQQRTVFGKKLIEQPVVRLRLGDMISAVEADAAWLNELAYNINKMSTDEVNKHLAGPIALLKYHSTRTASMVADYSCQVLGGRGITRSGMGNMVSNFYTSFKAAAIPGGSEEVMNDLGVRQAMKFYPKDEMM